jgi:hypothetical protein
MLFVFIIFVSVLTACSGAEKVTVEITPETKPPEEVKALPTETMEVEATVEKQPEEETRLPPANAPWLVLCLKLLRNMLNYLQ